MARVSLILAIVATIATISFSLPVMEPYENNELDTTQLKLDQKIGIPTEAIIEAMEQQFHGGDLARAGSGLFNLSAYINDPNRPAGTALTFVPLITLLAGLAMGNVAG